MHQLGYGLFNGSPKTITVKLVDLMDRNGNIIHTVSESTIQEASHQGRLNPDNSFSWSLSFGIPPVLAEVMDWTVEWHCIDGNGQPFIAIGTYE